MNEVREVIVIGGGPAAYTAALYSARANLNPLIIEGFAWGGQLMITSDVENYPGYPDGVLGPEMMQDLRRQAERFGTEFLTDDVTKVDFSERPFRVWVGEEEYRAETIVSGGSRDGVSPTARSATQRSSRKRRSWSWAAGIRPWRRRPSWRSSGQR
jgi:thioredoxin reductase